MSEIEPYLPRLASGLLTTCGIAAASILLAAAVAVVLGALRASRGRAPARAPVPRWSSSAAPRCWYSSSGSTTRCRRSRAHPA
ncbi:hypothetical protein [Phytohabitans flavus]|uniref:hypothetical protein n=1 Tax=Phytohabitans flavus TaxID=1076124 RepID=UPI001E44E0B0|nr:hypothetical protein [Phytohabitans flavus]